MKNCLQLIEPHLEHIFQEFYDRMLTDAHLSAYFTDERQIKALIRKQRQNIRETFLLDEEGLSRVYSALGEKHADMGIPLSVLASGLSFLYVEMLKVLTADCRGCDLIALFQYFQNINKSFAKGYFDRDIEEFEQHLQMLRLYAKESRFLKDHIAWFLSLIDAVRAGSGKDMDRREPVKYRFDRWMLSKESKDLIASDEERIRIHSLNTQLHLHATVLFHYLERREYQYACEIFSAMRKTFLYFSDIVESLDVRQLRRELSRDSLTGLLMRRDLERVLANEVDIAVKFKKPLSLIMADLDHFKRVNDTYGHPAGDAVLKSFAGQLLGHIRSTDYAFRYGGEEFLLILPATPKEAALRIAEKIRQAVEAAAVAFGRESLSVTASFGAAEHQGEAGMEADMLVQAADANLYKAKQAGRNRVAG